MNAENGGVARPESSKGVVKPSTPFEDSGRATRSRSWSSLLAPLTIAVVFLLGWDGAVRLSGSDLFPKPIEVWW